MNHSLESEASPALTPQQRKLTTDHISAFALYRELAVGEESLPFLVWYELATLMCANTPGIVGLGVRALLYPSLFGSVVGRLSMGRGVLLRNPRRIRIGKKVLVDDYAVLDARGAGAALELGDFVSVGRFTTLAAKGGQIVLSPGVNIGSYCRIATQSRVEIGASVLIAAYSYVGPGNHQASTDGTPLIARDMEIKGGVRIGAHAWIGAHATILDGVTIGEGAVVGAHALVREDVPAGVVVGGVPAKVIGNVSQVGKI